MICRTSLRRATGFSPRPIVARASFTTTIRVRNATATAPAASPAATSPQSTTPDLTPLNPKEAQEDTEPLSSCRPGTVLNGLNYFKGKTDPVALPDEAYPAWLWDCLEVQKKTADAADADVGDEFSKSRKQRRLANKRRTQMEDKMMASGNLEALAPKIPLPKQSINLPDGGSGGLEDAVHAIEKREELRKAMRKERKAEIKESNYLKTM
ncbi:mitochondrial ribosomal protein L37-domain-containing protein [Lasiosphaeria hispida]|uniref:Large ribosomal subunit protein mL54 n=1 Tax=Lasiosphaeria hispida TaxID=260671 RepID=A0AAJ0HU43_9PEZI|nr:mitochondrial ribosomal protein L37-domain-containing protein [Lasiosphaeria hispida]